MTIPLWLLVLLVVEVWFLAALFAVVVTRRTKLVFAAGFNVMIPVVAVYLWHAPTVHARAVIGAAMAGLYLLRLNWVILVWSKDTAMEKLDKAVPDLGKIGLAFVLVHSVGLGYCLPFDYIARDESGLSWWAWLALLIYVVGTVFHTGSDYQKRCFKQRPDTRSQVLRTGFWSLSRHPNYFGDFLIYVSFAVLAGHPWAWVAPVLNLLQYLFDAIPKSEKWATQKYGDAWKAYQESTPVFLPRLFGRS